MCNAIQPTVSRLQHTHASSPSEISTAQLEPYLLRGLLLLVQPPFVVAVSHVDCVDVLVILQRTIKLSIAKHGGGANVRFTQGAIDIKISAIRVTGT